jgi:hypothetical protein
MMSALVLLLSAPASADEFLPLHAPHAQASSYLKSDWNRYTENYHPSFLLDGNPRTAWVEGAAGNGIGEVVSWQTSPVHAVDKVRIRLRNGYQKSEKLLTANAAPKEIKVVWESLYQGAIHSQTWTLERKMGWQELVLDPPADEPFNGVRLEIVSTHPGRVYEDLCISDAELAIVPAAEGNEQSPYSRPIEQAKHQVLLDWVAERQATAAYFANEPEKYPFASTSFTSRDVALSDKEKAEALGRIGVVAGRHTAFGAVEGTAEPGWMRIETQASVRVPDGLEHLDEDLMRWFSPERRFEQTKDEWRSQSTDINPWHREHKVGNVRIARHADGTLAAAATRIYDLYEERGTYETDRRYLFDFDAKGQVSSFHRAWSSTGDGCETSHTNQIWDVSRDADGRVHHLTMTAREVCEDNWDTGETTKRVSQTVFSPVEG